MRVEWLYEAYAEYRDFLIFYKTKVGVKYAKAFAEIIQNGVRQLSVFPESGVLRKETLMGKHGFRALFIEQYGTLYRTICLYI